MAQIKITLVKGLAGTLPKQRKTIKALGLGKISSSVETSRGNYPEDDSRTRRIQQGQSLRKGP